MKQFIIEEAFWSLFPKAHIGVILCRGIDNAVRDAEKYHGLLAAGEAEARKHLTEAEFSQNGVIKVWREAFQQFKTKKGARSSIEALLKRVQNGNSVGDINPLVDIYNAISLKYALPCGGEDMDTFEGDMRLTLAQGDEAFVTLGTDESAPPYPGEVVYKDNAGAICRCWNWRESVRTMLTEKTQNAFLCIELVDETRLEALNEALAELAALTTENLGGSCSIFVLNSQNRQIELGE